MARAKKHRPPRPRRVAFAVSFELPAGALIGDAQDYVRNAVGGWDELHALFGLDSDTVRITRLYAKKRGTPVAVDMTHHERAGARM